MLIDVEKYKHKIILFEYFGKNEKFALYSVNRKTRWLQNCKQKRMQIGFLRKSRMHKNIFI
jgi:hypothetical protein